MSGIRVLEADIHESFSKALVVVFGESGEEIYNYQMRLGCEGL